MRGHLFENLIVTEMLKRRLNEGKEPNIYFYRDSNQNEIDIVAIDELEKTIIICEVKLAKKRLDQSVLEAKAKKLLADYPNYTIQWKLLSLEDV